ncbi:MAG: Holliday junction branch migration protein RuvA, partial [Lachnospiraceae bacterium]|nr:Holliday junction branch migration protein RuvA [Lachnospiraceae bacterium]
LSLSEALELSKEHVKAPEEAVLSQNIRAEAVEALTALGYSGAEALRAVKQVELKEDMTVEELLKASLKKIQY